MKIDVVDVVMGLMALVVLCLWAKRCFTNWRKRKIDGGTISEQTRGEWLREDRFKNGDH